MVPFNGELRSYYEFLNHMCLFVIFFFLHQYGPLGKYMSHYRGFLNLNIIYTIYIYIVHPKIVGSDLLKAQVFKGTFTSPVSGPPMRSRWRMADGQATAHGAIRGSEGAKTRGASRQRNSGGLGIVMGCYG